MKALSRTLLLCMVTALVGAPSISGALTLLDNFNGHIIDPSKFYGFESGSGPDTPIGEVFRQTVTNPVTGVGRLLGLTLTSYGDTLSNTGSAHQSQGLNVTHPGGITALQANVLIHLATVQSCPANTTFSSHARASIEGALFNSATSSPAADDATGDVRAFFEKVLDSGTGPFPVQTRFIQALLVLCNNQDCSDKTTLPGGVIFTKRWNFDASQKLRWEWNSAGSTVTFTLGPGTLHPEVHVVHYTQTNMAAPGRDVKGVQVSNREASCTAGRKGSLIQAGFDNVSTGP